MIQIHSILELAGVLLGVVALLAMLAMSRSMGRQRTRMLALEGSLAMVRRELEMMAAISLNTGRRVKRIEHDCSKMTDRVEQIEQRGSARSFGQAIDSARRGADPGKIARQFGLSRDEADLVQRLHGQKKLA
jgi:ABC-type lipoprotein release transport system permease subunit